MEKEIYFFSTEGYSPELPVLCRTIKKLNATNDREALLVECSEKIKDYGTKYLVLVPKETDIYFSNLQENPIFVYVINGSEYKDKDFIDLSPNEKIVMDWGGVSVSLGVANKWQVSKEDAEY